MIACRAHATFHVMSQRVVGFSLFLALAASSAPAASPPDTLAFGRFGTVHLYHPDGQPTEVVLFISGDGGWNKGVIDMAQALTSLDAVVVGIDINHYLAAAAKAPDRCVYAAADLEALSQYVQVELALPDYLTPVLVGYSSGATLAYATLVQAPEGTFKGAISLSFCPDLSLKKPLCEGAGLHWHTAPSGRDFVFDPASDLAVPWTVLQGEIDKVCKASQAEAFAAKAGSAQMVLLPRVGHGFSVQANWLPQLRQAFARTIGNGQPGNEPAGDSLEGLPLVEVQPQGELRSTIAVVLSGDGGWASLDRQVGDALAARGYPVLGLNSLRYFWRQRTPVEAASDLARILDRGFATWKAPDAILVGYSLGAEVLPFMAAGLPPELLQRVRLVALISPGTRATFQFHLTEWFGGGADEGRPIAPEILALRGTPVLCIFGSDETDSLCPTLDPSWGWVKKVELAGGHHLGGDYELLAATILADLPPPTH